MSDTIDVKIFKKTMDARIADLRNTALELGNDINVFRESADKSEIQKREIVGAIKEAEHMKIVFTQKEDDVKDS